RWAVIDWRAWNALVAYGQLGSPNRLKPRSNSRFTPEEYAVYMEEISYLAVETHMVPQQIDRWLYAFDCCGLVPDDLDTREWSTQSAQAKVVPPEPEGAEGR